MNDHVLPSFDGLRRRYRAESTLQPRQEESAHVVEYVRAFGRIVRTGTDVLAAISALPDEEELAAFRCREGVAVTHITDGWWLLFPCGPLPIPNSLEKGGTPTGGQP